MFQLTPIVKNILIINGIILFLEFILKISFGPLFGVHSIYSDSFFIFQYVTYMWLHADLWHLISNMFAVLVFGPMLERVWGAKRFLIFYLITGIGAGLLYGVADTVDKGSIKKDSIEFTANPNPDDFYIYIHNYGKDFNIVELGEFADTYFDNASNSNYESNAVSIVNGIYNTRTKGFMRGASGAVFGILLAFAMLFPNTELMLLFFPFPIKAKYLVFAYAAWEVYSEIFKRTGDNVSHFTHLSGMLVAFLILKYWQRQRGNFY
ncbi:rhomboid family intramembrane serine protease [Reichenbachiella sp.]|uniref:rhomboid family intramembrane serine protease n=1 Tax=Reichenbachiella sp. TaxID=2184521 RepID=UPI003BAEB19A